jgi:vitamin B12 transporter
MSLASFRRRSPRLLRRVVPLVFGCAFVPSHAQTAASGGRLETVVVSASREPLPPGWVAADVVVIDAERIRRSSADSLEDLLRREAGLQVSRNGGPGASAGLYVRGAGSPNTLVLVDGMRVGSATLGQAEFEAFSLASIERIEVLRGPASSLYGADGSGGVIQIFTRRGEAVPRVSARIAAGGYGAREGSLDASGRVGEVDLAAGLAHERVEGVSSLRPGDAFGNFNPDTDGSRRSSAQARAGWQIAPGHRVGANVLVSKLNGQYDASEFLPPTFAQDASPDFRNRLDNQVAALDWRGQWSPAWSSLLRAGTQESDSHSGGTQIDRFRTQRRQLDAQATWKFAANQQLTAAYEGLRERALSSSYSELQRDNDAVALAYAGQLAGIGVQADVRHDDNSVFGGVNTGRIGASVPIADGWRVRALAGSSYRAPSFNDLYFPGFGVATIRPERSKSIEAGIDGQFGSFEVSATAYRNRVRDLIVFEPDPAGCPPDPAYSFGCAANIGRASMKGLSLSGATGWDAWRVRGTLDFLDAKDTLTGARLNRRAANQASLSADYDAGPWSAGAALLHVGARPDGSAQLAAYTTIDLTARWRVTPQWTLEAKLLNVTDKDIEPVRDYQALGRQAWLALRWDGPGR